ncbi:FAD/NAD(P)-binding domain-containing protein [Gonapodya prolifera JEL478]|uniref:FAD/NAD(P)-binding domain-containing protein n=1 Tax=Gonapodya prolifera (strain JEL478) TaxID=1344416 RepID=A0A139AFA7_GONPJ|nr:FAD/NAD(P)-binding domain-containing protein [Gonapodya prolifera JEL478]|eukprot:KXS15467.1 FAD/NAD(P)-binding domain-containing protein [Gonapodya prolifera JEL478]
MATTTAIPRRKVAIVGAGIAGPAFALHILLHPLLRQQYAPLLIDPALRNTPRQASVQDQKEDSTAGAAVILFPNGLRALYRLGLRPQLERYSTELSSISFWSATGNSLTSPRFLSRTINPSYAYDVASNGRAIAREDLRHVLLGRMEEVAQEDFPEMTLAETVERYEALDDGRTRLHFAHGGGSFDADLVVGADGVWSRVRRRILECRDPATAAPKWDPTYMGGSGFYAVTKPLDESVIQSPQWNCSHGMLLDRGNITTSPLPEGRMRWDIQLADDVPPLPPLRAIATRALPDVPSDPWSTDWTSRIHSPSYPRKSTMSVLERFFSLAHPASVSFRHLVEMSERIVRSPLRQKVWDADDIQCGNTVLVGDAARVMLPSSGQGTSFAIEDAAVLANCLLQLPSTSSSLREALSSYAVIRVPRSTRMSVVSRFAGNLALGEKWYWRLMRDVAARSGGPDMKRSKSQSFGAWPFDFDVEDMHLEDRRED